MTAEKVANLIHMIEQQHRAEGFHKTLASYGLTIADWHEMHELLQKWYEQLREDEKTRPPKKLQRLCEKVWTSSGKCGFVVPAKKEGQHHGNQNNHDN